MGRLTAALLLVLVSACAHDWVEVEVSGQLILGSRYIEECASGDLYALLFPTEVAVDFTRRVEESYVRTFQATKTANVRAGTDSLRPAKQRRGFPSAIQDGSLASTKTANARRTRTTQRA